MRALQSCNRPAPPLGFCKCVIIDRGSLDVAGTDMVPATEIDRIFEPTDVHSWKLGFELGECHSIVCQDIQADERHSPRIAGKPSRPDWKHPVGSGKALYQLVQNGSDRQGHAFRWGHLPIHNDDATHGKPGRQLGSQHARRTMTHHKWLIGGGHMFEEMRGPYAPGRRRMMVGQNVRHLDTMSRRPQMPRRWLPTRRPDQGSCHKNEI